MSAYGPILPKRHGQSRLLDHSTLLLLAPDDDCWIDNVPAALVVLCVSDPGRPAGIFYVESLNSG
jgi:hypothetical protein